MFSFCPLIFPKNKIVHGKLNEKNNGGMRFNPNLYNCGKVCLYRPIKKLIDERVRRASDLISSSSTTPAH